MTLIVVCHDQKLVESYADEVVRLSRKVSA
jgi:ABC-type Mn2+/Zn2+ transport system ATPase subunit